MRRAPGPLLFALLTAGLLAGCGAGEVAPDGAPSPTGPVTGPVEYTPVGLVSRSAAGGRVDLRPTVLDDAEAVEGFVAQFRTATMRADLRSAVAAARGDVPEGDSLVGAVVMIGCDVPSGVRVQGEGDGLEIVPLEPATTHPECLVAVTTVALVSLDSAAAAASSD